MAPAPGRYSCCCHITLVPPRRDASGYRPPAANGTSIVTVLLRINSGRGFLNVHWKQAGCSNTRYRKKIVFDSSSPPFLWLKNPTFPYRLKFMHFTRKLTTSPNYPVQALHLRFGRFIRSFRRSRPPLRNRGSYLAHSLHAFDGNEGITAESSAKTPSVSANFLASRPSLHCRRKAVPGFSDRIQGLVTTGWRRPILPAGQTPPAIGDRSNLSPVAPSRTPQLQPFSATSRSVRLLGVPESRTRRQQARRRSTSASRPSSDNPSSGPRRFRMP